MAGGVSTALHPGYFDADGNMRLCTACGCTPRYCACDVPGFPRAEGMAWEPNDPGPGWHLQPYSRNGHAPDPDEDEDLAAKLAWEHRKAVDQHKSYLRVRQEAEAELLSEGKQAGPGPGAPGHAARRAGRAGHLPG